MVLRLLLLLLLVTVQARRLRLLLLHSPMAVALVLLLRLLVEHLRLLLVLRWWRRLADGGVCQRPDLWLGGRDGNSGLGVVVDVRLGAGGGEARGGEGAARPVEGRGGPGQVAAVQRVVDSVQAKVVV